MRTRNIAVAIAVAACWSGLVGAAEAPPAKTLDVVLLEQLQPTAREWVTAEARKLTREPGPQEPVARADIRTRFQGQALSAADEDRLTYLVVFTASRIADAELKAYIEQLQAGRETPPKTGPPGPAAGVGLQVGPAGVPSPRVSPSTGRITFEPGPSPGGSTSIGIGSATVGAGGASNAPGALAVSPAQGMRLQTMTNSRNQLVALSNNLGHRLPPGLDTQLPDLR